MSDQPTARERNQKAVERLNATPPPNESPEDLIAAGQKWEAEDKASSIARQTADSPSARWHEANEQYADVSGDRTTGGRLETESPRAILHDVREQQRQEAAKAAQDFWAQAVTVGQQMRSEQAAQKAEDTPRQTQRA